MQQISFDTAKTVLVPAELYAEGTKEDYLRFSGMALAADEVAVASAPESGIVAVMAVTTDEWNRYEDRYERGELAVSSPLLAMTGGAGGRRDVCIHLTEGNLYLTVWEGGLRMAEVMPDNSLDSILYYLQVVGRRFTLRKFSFHVSGPRAGLVADSLRRYYKKVRVTT
jgi:hypothetical protein